MCFVYVWLMAYKIVCVCMFACMCVVCLFVCRRLFVSVCLCMCCLFV